jgi:hypothetical protein
MLLVTTFVERLFFCARWIVLAQPAEAQAPQRRASAASTASSLPCRAGLDQVLTAAVSRGARSLRGLRRSGV